MMRRVVLALLLIVCLGSAWQLAVSPAFGDEPIDLEKKKGEEPPEPPDPDPGPGPDPEPEMCSGLGAACHLCGQPCNAPGETGCECAGSWPLTCAICEKDSTGDK